MLHQERTFPAAKRQRLLKAFGSPPAGYTHEELEHFLDLFYGLFSYTYTAAELRQMKISDPFDRSDRPRQLTVKDLSEWLEAVVA